MSGGKSELHAGGDDPDSRAGGRAGTYAWESWQPEKAQAIWQAFDASLEEAFRAGFIAGIEEAEARNQSVDGVHSRDAEEAVDADQTSV